MAANDGSVVFKVTADDKEAQAKLNQLRRDIEKAEKAINTTNGKKSAIVEQLEQARKEAVSITKEIEALNAQKLENDAVLSGQAGNVSLEEFEARKQAQAEITYELKEQQKAKAAQEAIIAKLEAKEQEITAQLERQTAQLEQQKTEAGEVERVIAQQATSTMPQLANAAEAVSAGMRKGFKSILKWGFGIRSAFILMRRLRSAIVEGVKAFAEQDEETRNNINGLKASLATLKQSWGAAFAPIFNAVVPILQKLISWLTTAANAVAMFFAALTGKSTYKRAVANNGDLAESYSEAGEAAEEAEKQIMGFDEINKLDDKSKSSNNGGGAGSGAAEEMYEEVPVLESVKKHLDDILIVVGLIGSALLAWKLAPLLGLSFTKMLGILASIIGAVELVHGGLDAWNNGVNMDNLLDMLKGVALLVGGLALAFGVVGAAIGLLISGIALLIVGLHDWIKTGELSTETFYALEIGILAVGAALALLLGWPALIVAAVAALALAIYKYWDKIKEKGSELKDSLKNTWGDIKDAASDAWDGVKKTVSNAIEKIKGFLKFEWKLPHLPMPHVILSAGEWPWGLMGKGVPPKVDIQWYAKGGIIDGATLIGAGEAGKEAIVPLERNTDWINMVADGIIDRLSSGSDFISGRALPALASGQVVPPNALNNSGSSLSDGDISRLVNGFLTAFGPLLSAGGSNRPMVASLNVNGREFCRATFYDQQAVSKEHGISLITG